MKHPEIFLFDLDGVLIQPRGYREAIRATINYFTGQLGLGDLAPGEDILALFESQSITNEWDIVPICLGLILETVLGENPGFILPDGLLEKTTPIPRPKASLPFRERISRASSCLQAGLSPSESLLSSGVDGPFPILAQQGLFKELFGCNQNVAQSVTTRTFQNFVLGSQSFSQIYHLPAVAPVESYLKIYDRPILKYGLKKHMEDMISDHNLHVAALTARPSLAPRGAPADLEGFSPEAEQALELVGLSQIPLIGFGRLQFAASQLKLSPNLLIKPAPYQALAAILAAVSGSELAALKTAASLCHQVGLIPDSAFFSTAEPIHHLLSSSGSKEHDANWSVHIFEDSPIGIHASQLAGELLNRAGIRATVKAWGIAENHDKVQALEAVGATVFPDINLALDHHLATKAR